jgi:methyl-accepting chemotaxis protein
MPVTWEWEQQEGKQMKWFRNWKIGTKIITGFFILALVVAVVGVMGLLNLKTANEKSSTMYTKDTVSVGELSEAAQLYQRTRVIVRDIILIDDDERMQSEVENLKGKDDAITDSLGELDLLMDTPEHKTMLNTINQSISAYAPLRQKVLDAALAGDAAGAYALLESPDTDAAAMAIQDAISALEEKLLAHAAAENLDSENTARMEEAVTIGLIAVGVALAVLLGVLISRAISKPIGKLADAANKLAAGQTDFEMKVRESKDEVGILASSFKAVQNTVASMIDDVDKLANAAEDGCFTCRADADRHPGDFGRLIRGFNNTISTFISDFDKLPIPVLRIDKNFTIQYMNKKGAELVGKTQQELIGTKCFDAFKTGDCKTSNCACFKAMESKSMQESETTANPHEGVSMEIKYGGTPAFKNGEVIGALEVVMDMTEIKRAHRAAEQQSETLKNLLAEIDIAAEQVAAGTRQVSDGSQEISQGATEQASAIEELTASVSQIAQQTRQNAMSAGKANELASAAASEASHGNERMQAMEKAMDEISESSRSISKIIKVIDDIAFQTNILALNAAVEAARAGVHGKGFAVVAEEVRNLAARSASAAKETTELIEGSIAKTEAGTKIADETTLALASIVKSVDKAAQLVGEIATASNEQATSIAQVDRGIEQMSSVVQTNSATSEETAAAAEELSSQAEMLKNLVGQFHLNNSESRTAPPSVKKPAAKKAALNIPKINISDGDFGKY